MTTPTIVSGGPSTWADLGQDEGFLRDWLREQPGRLGLGDLTVVDGDPVRDDLGNPAFIAADDDHYYSIDVRLSEMDASGGFGLLDNWARNRVRHLDKTHVAVLVTETVGERYRATLQTLTEHLPLIVVELQVWRGETEAILVPRVSLASAEVDLGAASAAAASTGTPQPAAEAEAADTEEPAAEADGPEAGAAAEEVFDDEAAETAEIVAAMEASSDRDGDGPDADETGVDDPWGLPSADHEGAAASGNGKRLLTRITS